LLVFSGLNPRFIAFNAWLIKVTGTKINPKYIDDVKALVSFVRTEEITRYIGIKPKDIPIFDRREVFPIFFPLAISLVVQINY
jgi:hypothetical protein